MAEKKKGAQALFNKLKAMGYKKNGGESLLNKMTYGGASMDMADNLEQKMRSGSETKRVVYSEGGSKKMQAYKMGGWTASKKK